MMNVSATTREVAREIMAATCEVKTERPTWEESGVVWSWCEAHTPDAQDGAGWEGESDLSKCPAAIRAATAVLAAFTVTRRPPPPPPARKPPVRTAALQHVWFVCDCNRTACQFCDGGLGACTTCGGFEGSLPTHCPGADMGRFTEEKVYVTDLDFVNGAWVRNPHKKWQRAEGLPSMEREKVRRGW